MYASRKINSWLFSQLYGHVLPTLDELALSGRNVDLMIIGSGIHNVYSISQHIQYWLSRTMTKVP